MSDRDKRRIKTPPKGVAEQLAPPESDSWEGAGSHTPLHPTPVDMQTIDAPAPPGFEAIDQRIKQTKNSSIDTLSGITDLRREYKLDHKALHEKVDGVAEVQTQMLLVQGKMLGELGESKGQNNTIIRMIDDLRTHRDNTERVVTTKRIAEVEVDTTRQIADVEIDRKRSEAEIDTAKEVRTARIEVVKKVLLGLVALGTALVGGAQLGAGC